MSSSMKECATDLERLRGTDKFQDKETGWLGESNISKYLLAELQVQSKEDSVYFSNRNGWKLNAKDKASGTSTG